MAVSAGSGPSWAIPADLVRSGERVILAEKPHVRAFVTVGLLVYLAIAIVVWLLLTVVAGVFGGALGAVVVLIILFLIFPLWPLILAYRAQHQWQASWYALTDQRVVVAGTGLSSLSQATTDFPLRVLPGSQMAGVTLYRVKQISVNQGYFGQRLGFGNIVFLADPSSFVWRGVVNPVKVKTLLEANFNELQESGYIGRRAQEKFTDQVAAAYGQQQEGLAITVASMMPAPLGINPNLKPSPAAVQSARSQGAVSGAGPPAAQARGPPVLVRCPYCKNVYDETSTGKCPNCGATF